MSYVGHFREAGKWHFRQKNDRPGSEISGYHKRVIDHPANSPPVSQRNQGGEGMNGILPRKLTYPMENYGWKIMFFLKWSIFRGHVGFRGCKCVCEILHTICVFATFSSGNEQ